MNQIYMSSTTILSHTLWEYDSSTGNLDTGLVRQIRELKIPKAISIKHGRLHTRSYVGVVGWEDTQIQILPKLYRYDTDLEKEQKASRNLLHLLQLSGVFSSRLYTDSASLMLRKTRFFDVLIYLFALRLSELLRQGITRSYEPVEDEIPFLKGSWQFHQQIARRPYTAQNFHVCYDELTENIALHRVLKYAARLLLQITGDDENRDLLSDILRSYTDVDDCTTPDNDRKKVMFTRLNDSYKPVFTLAEMFFEQLSVQLAHGGVRLWGLLFDMNVLFEKLVPVLLRHADVLDKTPYRDCELHQQDNTTHLVYTEDQRPFFRLKPDIRLTRGNTTECIIDTKYKPLDSRQKNKEIKREDMYQMFAYAHRFDCPRIILLYPTSTYFNREHETVYFIPGGKQIEIRAVDIRGDLHDEQEYRQLLGDIRRIIIGDTA